MPVNTAHTLTAGPLTLHNVAASIHAVRAGTTDRNDAPGAGIAVELPALLELLDAVASGHVTGEEAREAFEAETKRAGGSPRADVEVQRGAAPADVAAILGETAGAEVVIRSRRMYDDERLVQLADTYIPAAVAEAAPAVAQLDTGEGGIISRMAEAGLTQADVVEDVEQRPATTEQAEALGVEAGELLLTITHTGRTEEGRAVEVTRHVLSRGWTLRYGVPLG